MRIKQVSRERGVTLIELLIYVAIVSGILIVISDAFLAISATGRSIDAKTEVNSNMRFATQKIIGDIKSATSVSVPTVVGATASTLQLLVSGQTILYDVTNGQLRRSINGTPDAVTSSLVTVSTPTFTRLENYQSVLNATTTSIRVNMTLRYNSSSTNATYTDTINVAASLP